MEGPGRNVKIIFDYIIANKMSIVKNTIVIQKFNVRSDHILVRATIKLDIKLGIY